MDTAQLVLVAVGIPVAVKTPVGIVLVVLPRVVDLETVLLVVEGGALIMTLEGGTDGLPATVLMLDAGVFQSDDRPYRTPLIMMPARLAMMFF